MRFDAWILEDATRLVIGLCLGAPFVLHRWRDLRRLIAARVAFGETVATGVRSTVGLSRRRLRRLSDKRRRTLLAVQGPIGAGEAS
jgi:hypothetical protein